MKRAIDILFSSIGLAIMTPVCLLVAVGLKLTSPGPIFFRQERLGWHGRRFLILKFRTMTVPTADPGLAITAAGDSRITPFGRFLRRHKLDELPQLLNVLRGEMSLVGPRPEVAEFAEFYPLEFARILKVKPGITHPATLLFRCEEEILARAADPRRLYIEKVMPEKLAAYEADLHRSLLADIRTVIATVLPDLFRRWTVEPYRPQRFAGGRRAVFSPEPVLTVVENIPAFARSAPFRDRSPAATTQEDDRRTAVV